MACEGWCEVRITLVREVKKVAKKKTKNSTGQKKTSKI